MHRFKIFLILIFLFAQKEGILYTKSPEVKDKKDFLSQTSQFKKMSQKNQVSFKKKKDSIDLVKSKEEKKKPIDPEPFLPPPNQWPASLVSLSQKPYYSKYHFVMDKSKRTLSLWKGEKDQVQWVNAFPADQGKKVGDKHILGDLKTPEGIYFFQKTYAAPDLDFKLYGVRAFTMDYPNFFDRLKKKTGSGIWLHSIPDYESLYKGSRGCLVVRIKVIEKLKDFIQLKTTPIIVQNEVEYLSKEQHGVLKKKMKDWFFSWKKAWEKKDIDEYISYYSNQFRSLGKNKNQWKIYKDSLNQKYQFIRISVDDFVIYKHENQFVIRFLQDYTSDQWADYGEKFLYVQKKTEDLSKSEKGKEYQIVGETWSKVNRPNLF